jgi:Ni,Fe-hydrogenase III large subunit
MTSSVLGCRVSTTATPMRDARALRAAILQRLDDGARLLTFFGRRVEDDVLLTAALVDGAGAIAILRGRTARERGFHALTADVPAAHCFERELHESCGLPITGHPWRKPIRYEGGTQRDMASYPYHVVEGKEVHEVAVGPIHAGVIEPGAFRFMCLGEQVHHLEIQLGYQHRGVEKRLLEVAPRHLLPLVETIAGDTSVANAWAHCAAVERLADCQLTLDVEIARAICLELERVAMHLVGLSGLAADIGFLQGATTYGRLRTTIINTTMRLSGSRFGKGAVRPGGVGLDSAEGLRREVEVNLASVRRDLGLVNDLFLGARTVRHRLRSTGVLTRAQASELGLVGLAARSSGLPVDTRGHGEGAYGALPIAVQVREEGDCWARALVRIAELEASLEWIRAALRQERGWSGERRALGPLAPEQLAVAVVEGWRGEVVHCIETDAAGGIVHYKVQDPSFRNWMGLAVAVRENEIADFPICNKSFDLSYCGNDL